MHWTSYLLGLLTLPALLAIVVATRAAVRLAQRLLDSPGLPADRPAQRSAALEFSPRLIRQIRRPEALPEESARAS